jgi:hypothetical protein
LIQGLVGMSLVTRQWDAVVVVPVGLQKCLEIVDYLASIHYDFRISLPQQEEGQVHQLR